MRTNIYSLLQLNTQHEYQEEAHLVILLALKKQLIIKFINVYKWSFGFFIFVVCLIEKFVI